VPQLSSGVTQRLSTIWRKESDRRLSACAGGARVDGYDAAKGEIFYSPPGGGVEFGERAVDAARRELREELAAEVCGLTLLGVLENIFTFEGQPGHEIVFVFEARFADAALYEREVSAWCAPTVGLRPR
jgi:ADP-ribose pyrophosphatase YjhB (NUDIX family)